MPLFSGLRHVVRAFSLDPVQPDAGEFLAQQVGLPRPTAGGWVADHPRPDLRSLHAANLCLLLRHGKVYPERSCGTALEKLDTTRKHTARVRLPKRFGKAARPVARARARAPRRAS